MAEPGGAEGADAETKAAVTIQAAGRGARSRRSKRKERKRRDAALSLVAKLETDAIEDDILALFTTLHGRNVRLHMIAIHDST